MTFLIFDTILCMKRTLLCLIEVVFLLSGCMHVTDETPSIIPTITIAPEKVIELDATATNTLTASVTSSPTYQKSILPSVVPSRILFISSPLSGVNLVDLPEMIFNPYSLPMPGSDNPHQGVDFSDVDPETKNARTGLGVGSILRGRVVSMISDRFPYGNALMIATDWQDLPSVWQSVLGTQPLPERWQKNSALSCPEGWDEIVPGLETQTLYILYAHLLNRPQQTIGEEIRAGEEIGQIGMSGNALAPHLHVEMRYGPASQFFDGMAHYDVTATAVEMRNYCRWRISGLFRPLDPMVLLQNP